MKINPIGLPSIHPSYFFYACKNWTSSFWVQQLAWMKDNTVDNVLSSVRPLTASKVPVSVLMLSIAVSRVYPAGSRIHSGFRDDLPYQAAVCATTRNQIKEFKVSFIINVHMPKHQSRLRSLKDSVIFHLVN